MIFTIRNLILCLTQKPMCNKLLNISAVITDSVYTRYYNSVEFSCFSFGFQGKLKIQKTLIELSKIFAKFAGKGPWSSSKIVPFFHKNSNYTHAISSLFLAVNHHNFKNWVPSILTHNLWLIFMGMKQKNNSKWPTQKNWVFQHRQKLSNFRQNFMDWSLG